MYFLFLPYTCGKLFSDHQIKGNCTISKASSRKHLCICEGMKQSQNLKAHVNLKVESLKDQYAITTNMIQGMLYSEM